MRKTFAFYGAHPSLREGIQIRAAWRELQALHTSCGQALAEFSAELSIAVVEHIAMAEQISRFVVHCVASHLGHPLLRGMTRDASQAYAPGLQMQEEQNVVRHQAPPRQDLYREEVGSCEHVHVPAEELLPARLFPPFGTRCDVVAALGLAPTPVGKGCTQGGTPPR